MIVPGSPYWNLGMGHDKVDVLSDDEALLALISQTSPSGSPMLHCSDHSDSTALRDARIR